MAKKAAKSKGKKKTPIWYAITILAVIATGIIGAGVSIYWERLFPESHKKMTRAVSNVATQAKTTAQSRFNDLLKRASKFSFSAQGMPLCQEAESQISTPKGWQYRDMATFLGLPEHPTRDAILARCQAYASAIVKMQDLSGPKQNYEVICADQGTYFELDARRGYGIYPRKGGVRQKVSASLPADLPVRRGETRLVFTIQVHGIGRGCYVIGSDKASTFQRAGQVKKE